MTEIKVAATCTCECGCLVLTTQGWCYDCDKNCRNIPNTPVRKQEPNKHILNCFFAGCNCMMCRGHSEALQRIHLRSAVDRKRFLRTARERRNRASNPGQSFWAREAEIASKLVTISEATHNL